jgi:hypothetical protein
MTEQSYDSITRFADRTSLSARQVWRLLRSNDLPSIRVGGRRLIPIEDGLAALQQLDSSSSISEQDHQRLRNEHTAANSRRFSSRQHGEEGDER